MGRRLVCVLCIPCILLLFLCILLLSLCILLLSLCIEERWFKIIPPTLEVAGGKLCDGCGNGIIFLGKCRAVRNGIAY